ncbi:MAG: hypothetical protein C0423_00110 [Methylibium sp.]|nr:hypothetical protein [Methylibium sp.]
MTCPESRRRGRQPALAALLLALLSACTTVPPPETALPDADTNRQRQQAFDQSQRRWHGASVQELLAKQGPPSSRSRDAHGQQRLSYTRTLPLKAPTGPQSASFSCTVHYLLDAKGLHIVSHRIEGC